MLLNLVNVELYLRISIHVLIKKLLSMEVFEIAGSAMWFSYFADYLCYFGHSLF